MANESEKRVAAALLKQIEADIQVYRKRRWSQQPLSEWIAERRAPAVVDSLTVAYNKGFDRGEDILSMDDDEWAAVAAALEEE